MPKLTDDRAKMVDEVEASFQGTFPADHYELRLTEVEATISSTKSPMWIWKFEVCNDAKYNGASVWEFTVLTDKAMWKLKQIFEAFGVPANTHTDDLVGRTVAAFVDLGVANAGKNKGKPRNEIREYFAPGTEIVKENDSRDRELPPVGSADMEDELPF